MKKQQKPKTSQNVNFCARPKKKSIHAKKDRFAGNVEYPDIYLSEILEEVKLEQQKSANDFELIFETKEERLQKKTMRVLGFAILVEHIRMKAMPNARKTHNQFSNHPRHQNIRSSLCRHAIIFS
ncbi:unnamed protein product [Caenorhabditis angaria]|uniref:Uncharacterized protein n=1 Tax=Caenorhabditis angaria TaxID=860376 RepID=A0A9P1J5H2_9PELO|nr:unnamed protein product [Caenorhabditis angaria]